MNDDRVILAASALIEAEVHCAGMVRDGTQLVLDQVRGWLTAEVAQWTDVDRFLTRDAARLACQWYTSRDGQSKKLGGADTTHLAASVRLRRDYLIDP